MIDLFSTVEHLLMRTAQRYEIPLITGTISPDLVRNHEQFLLPFAVTNPLPSRAPGEGVGDLIGLGISKQSGKADSSFRRLATLGSYIIHGLDRNIKEHRKHALCRRPSELIFSQKISTLFV